MVTEFVDAYTRRVRRRTTLRCAEFGFLWAALNAGSTVFFWGSPVAAVSAAVAVFAFGIGIIQLVDP